MGHSRWAAPKAHGEHKGYGEAKRRDISGPGGHLAKCEPFDGHSMRARWEPATSHPDLAPFSNPNTQTDRALYVVYSYDQAIAAYDPTDGTIHTSTYRYSHKTSEHQNAARAWTGRNYSNHDGTYGQQYDVLWEQVPMRGGYISELV